MTLQQAKDKIAKKYGYNFFDQLIKDKFWGRSNSVHKDGFQLIDEAAELYAQSQKAKAWDEGQKEIEELKEERDYHAGNALKNLKAYRELQAKTIDPINKIQELEQKNKELIERLEKSQLKKVTTGIRTDDFGNPY